ncbi:AraC family transcriptional regulator [Paenibacillus sp. FSL K6-1230]
MLPFSLIEMPRDSMAFPLYPYSVGRHNQYHHVRPTGFPVAQLFMVRSGQGLFRDMKSGSETILEPGMAYFFPSERGHEYFPLSHERWHMGFVGIGGSQALEILQTLNLLPSEVRRLDPGAFESCWGIIEDIWRMVNNQTADQHGNQLAQELSVQLYRLLLFVKSASDGEQSIGRPAGHEVRNEAMQKAIQLINEHFTEPLQVHNLAAAVGYSVQHFQRLFQQEYGTSPHQYLQNLRLQRAVQMITEDPELPVQDIALHLGMETNYFIRVFRKAYGCTPGVMKERLSHKGHRIHQEDKPLHNRPL